MADRSHLTPARTTDKNGRNTTVYRNQAAAGNPAAAKASVPAPASPALPGALREPKSLGAAELEELAADLGRASLHPMSDLRAMLVTEPNGRTAAALAAEAIESGVLTEPRTRALFLRAANQGAAAERAREGIGAKVGARLARDLLLVAARVAARRPAHGHRWTHELTEAMDGARSNRTEALETEAQLDSLSAVEFTMEARELGDFTGIAHGVGSGTLRSITNRDLDTLLRERPHDLDRIMNYIAERSIYSMDSKDVDDLREWLHATEAAPSLSGGWL